MKPVDLWHEVEPLVRHAIAGTVLIGLKYGIVKLLEKSMDGEERSAFNWLDTKGTLVIFALFICYTIALLLIRMYKSLKKEARSDED